MSAHDAREPWDILHSPTPPDATTGRAPAVAPDPVAPWDRLCKPESHFTETFSTYRDQLSDIGVSAEE